LDFDILIPAVADQQSRQSRRRRYGRVSDQVVHIETQQGARHIPYNDLGFTDTQSVVLAKVARGREGSAVKPDGLPGRLNNPDAFMPLDTEGNARVGPGHQNVWIALGDGIPRTPTTR